MSTLIINLSDSQCGACGKSADPYEDSHVSILGYHPGPGCGAVYTHVTSHYMGVSERVKEMRPDLIWSGFEDSLG